MMVLDVRFKVKSEAVDALSQYRNLDIGRSCVLLMSFKLVNDFLLLFFGKETLAFDEYVIAFQHMPSAKVARNLGFIATRQNRFSEGTRWFGEATRLAPENAETWFNLGFANERSGQQEDAVKAFREAVRLNPSLDRAWYGLGLAQSELKSDAEAAASL